MKHRFNWKVERFGIEKVCVADGNFLAEDMEDAKSKVRFHSTDNWSDWEESEIFITDLSGKDICVPSCKRESNDKGKTAVLTLWKGVGQV